MTALLSPPPKIQFFDDEGDPLDGGKVYTYEAGTSTPKTAWKDEAATVPHTNPIILNARGEPPASALFLEGSYKINVTDSSDVQITGYPVDNITAYGLLDWSALTASIADLNSTTTTTLSKTADYPIVLTDRGKTVLADATSGKVTITLLPTATAKDGYRITIKKTDVSVNIVEIATNAAETIDTASNFELYDINDYIEVLCDGSNWKVVSGQIRGTMIAVSATQPITFSDDGRTYLIDASGGAVTINLLSAGVVGRGYDITVKKIDSSTNAVTLDADGAETIDGAGTFIVKEQYGTSTIKSDGSNWHIVSDIVSSGNVDLARGYIAGFVTNKNAGLPTTAVDIASGSCRDAANALDINLTSTLTKRYDQDWVEGNNNGGWPRTGVARAFGKWVHYFMITKDDGTVDAGWDTSTTATNLLVDATGYTGYRRIWSHKTQAADSTAFLGYIQKNEMGYWDDVPIDLSIQSSATTADISISTPPDVNVDALLNVTLESNGSGVAFSTYISPVGVTGIVGAITAVPGACVHAPANVNAAGFISVLAINQEIAHTESSATANNDIRIFTLGWIDDRGKND